MSLTNPDDQAKFQMMRSICGEYLTPGRAFQLLEAGGGSVERAMDILCRQDDDKVQNGALCHPPDTGANENGNSKLDANTEEMVWRLDVKDPPTPTKGTTKTKRKATKRKARPSKAGSPKPPSSPENKRSKKRKVDPSQSKMESYFTVYKAEERSRPRTGTGAGTETETSTPPTVAKSQLAKKRARRDIFEEQTDHESDSSDDDDLHFTSRQESEGPYRYTQRDDCTMQAEQLDVSKGKSDAEDRVSFPSTPTPILAATLKSPPTRRPLQSDCAQVSSGGSATTQSPRDAATAKTTAKAQHRTNDMNSDVPFERLANALQELADTTKRLQKLDTLKVFIEDVIEFYDLPGNDQQSVASIDADHERAGAGTMTQYDKASEVLGCSMLIMLGRPTSTIHAPLDVSWGTVSKALCAILGIQRSQLSTAYRETGDMGDAAARYFTGRRAISFFAVSASTQKARGLTIVGLYDSLNVLSKTSGHNAKENLIRKLFRSCKTKSELGFLVRLLISNMRVGANIKTLLAALALVVARRDTRRDQLDIKKVTSKIQNTHDVCPNLELIIRSLLAGGIAEMERACSIQLSIPISPMLATASHSLEEVQKLMQTNGDGVVLEWKYDGVRCQAHWDGRQVRLFSRNLLEKTAQFPDAAQAILDAAVKTKGDDNIDANNDAECEPRQGAQHQNATAEPVTSFILDSEIVGVEKETTAEGRTIWQLLPFQDLAKRKRKEDDGKGVHVKVFAFDLMYLNGRSLIKEPLWKRQELLRQHFRDTDDFAFVSSRQMLKYDETLISTFLQESVDGGAEGLMVKLLGRSTNNTLADETNDTSCGADDVACGKHANIDVSIKAEPCSQSADMLQQDAGLNTTQHESQDDSKVGDNDDGQSTLRLKSPYEAGSRSRWWLKVKRDYVDGCSDTIDVVPIGAWRGTGRKAQRNFLSPVLLAVYDEQEDVFRSISRCMSFTDKMYDAMREFYLHDTPYPHGVGVDGIDTAVGAATSESEANGDNERTSHGINEPADVRNGDGDDDDDDNGADDDQDEPNASAVGVNCYPSCPSSAVIITNESPPIWFKPMEVFEVSFADMSLSLQHTAAAGLVDGPEGRGVALRFPRFKRRRPDKRIDQATTCAQIAHMFAQQAKHKNRKGIDETMLM